MMKFERFSCNDDGNIRASYLSVVLNYDQVPKISYYGRLWCYLAAVVMLPPTFYTQFILKINFKNSSVRDQAETMDYFRLKRWTPRTIGVVWCVGASHPPVTRRAATLSPVCILIIITSPAGFIATTGSNTGYLGDVPMYFGCLCNMVMCCESIIYALLRQVQDLWVEIQMN